MNVPLMLIGGGFVFVALMGRRDPSGSSFNPQGMDGVAPPPLASSVASSSPVGDFFSEIEKWHFGGSAPAAPTLAVPPITAPAAVTPAPVQSQATPLKNIQPVAMPNRRAYL